MEKIQRIGGIVYDKDQHAQEQFVSMRIRCCIIWTVFAGLAQVSAKRTRKVDPRSSPSLSTEIVPREVDQRMAKPHWLLRELRFQYESMS
jgi:hypothetical protein